MTKPLPSPNLIVILGDQLSPDIAALRVGDPQQDIVLMAEVRSETDYVPHHKKKIAFIFSAMRHFAETLRQRSWTVDYVALDAKSNCGSLTSEIERAAAEHGCGRIYCTEPGEWRLRNAFEQLAKHMTLEILEDDRFLCNQEDFSTWWKGRRQPRMEHFYREVRRKSGLLMAGDKPVGGRWSFDSDIRKPPKPGLTFPEPQRFNPDAITQNVIELVDNCFPYNFGRLKPFWFGVTQQDAQAALDHFVTVALPDFGDYQDAMVQHSPFLFHALISLYLNVGLLDPRDVCVRAEAAYREGSVPLNAAEGFIRQIIGWREYIRGLYWQEMPSYVDHNIFCHTSPLPTFYWTGETELACLNICIKQTHDEAYTHHIQRLIVTGNFAMLAGIEPKAVHEWYLAVYADAFEWVELPNTLGMSQHADGGLLGTKPYAASGNYINRMSDYCGSCRYNVKEKTGPNACPLNYLYWDFFDRNRDTLGGNPRLTQVYRTWDRMESIRKVTVREDAKRFLRTLS